MAVPAEAPLIYRPAVAFGSIERTVFVRVDQPSATISMMGRITAKKPFWERYAEIGGTIRPPYFPVLFEIVPTWLERLILEDMAGRRIVRLYDFTNAAVERDFFRRLSIAKGKPQ